MNTINYTSNGLSQFYSDSRFTGINGQGQTIAVIDAGFNLKHAGFGADKNNDGISDVFHRKDLDFTTRSNGVNDINSHGLSVSSVAYSIAPGIKILPIQVLTVSSLTTALNWVSENKDVYNISAVNMSISDYMNTNRNVPGENTKDLYTALGNLEEKGITAVASAGNYYQGYRTEGCSSIAGFTNVIGVMNTASNGLTEATSLKPSSQRRNDLIGAPGTNIKVFKPNNSIQIGAGTSYSSPFVTGSVALLQGVAERYMGRQLNPAEVKDLIDKTDNPVAQTYEQIDVFKAADLIYKIGTGQAPNTLSKSPLTVDSYTNKPDPEYRYPSEIFGSPYIDVLTGKSTTSNTFHNNMGNDLLVGGKGTNTFVYDTLDGSKDDILHFTPGKDKLDVSNLLDSINYRGSNPLASQYIRVGVSNVTNSVISFDRDGIGGGQPQVLATLIDTNPGTINNVNNFIF